MANARKCDNCGKYYEPYASEGPIKHVRDVNNDILDLCPGCLKAANEALEKNRNQIPVAPVIDPGGVFTYRAKTVYTILGRPITNHVT